MRGLWRRIVDWRRRLFGRASAPAPAPAAASQQRLPRGMRNNNPLNIEYQPRTGWIGQAIPGTDGRFVRFTDMGYGVRAAALVLRNYQTKHGLRTVAGIVGRWAPAVENNVAAYVASVNRHAGFKPGQQLDLFDNETLVKLIRAMARHECGVDLDENVARAGVAMVR